MSTYNILLATDANYLPYCFVTCQSVVNSLRLSKQSELDTIIFNLFIDEDVQLENLGHKCDSFTKRNNTNYVQFKFNLVPVSPAAFENAPKFKSGTLTTYYRLLVGDLLSNDIDRVLYLDCDVLVRNDIRILFNELDLTDTVLAGAIDYGMEYEQGEPNDILVKSNTKSLNNLYINIKDYFNAGVLLINLSEYRQQRIYEKCIEILEHYTINAHDQDLLNLIVDKKKILPMTWNFMSFSYFHSYSKESKSFSLLPSKLNRPRYSAKNDVPEIEEFISISEDPSICHFNQFKPWGKTNCLNTSLPLNNALTKILKEWYVTAEAVTEFSDELRGLKYCQFNNYDVITCFLNERIAVTQETLDKQITRRRRDRNVMLSLLALLFITQIATLIMIICGD